MKIALIGNMNNNFFAMLRYFRDLGMDATLFLFKNEQQHFLPKHDTWEFEKWAPYIIQTDLVNGITKKNISMFSVSKYKIRKLFSDYDIIIGCGISPVYLHKAGLKLHLFIPYGSGVEHTHYINTSLTKIIGTLLSKYLQEKAISKSVLYSISFEKETQDKLIELNQKVLPLGMPMLYNREVVDKLPANIQPYIEIFKKQDMVVFSHVSHIWKNIPADFRHNYTKNDVLIYSFAKYLKSCKLTKPLLVLVQYGPDVEYSKQLIKDLEIDKKVLWLPRMSRNEIMLLLDYIDIGVGKLGGMSIWGSVGWEFMAKGIPFFWNLTQTKDDYQQLTGNPFPPGLIHVSTVKDIVDYLLFYENDKTELKKLSDQMKNWFEKYGGIGLARKYKELVEEIYTHKPENG